MKTFKNAKLSKFHLVVKLRKLKKNKSERIDFMFPHGEYNISIIDGYI